MGASPLGMSEIPETSAGEDNDGFHDNVIDEVDDEEEEHNTYF